MAIDPRFVKWDDAPAAIDPASIQWDDAPAAPQETKPKAEQGTSLGQHAGNLLAGAIRGAGSIGATILAPYDIAKDALAGKGLSLESNRERRAGIDGGLRELGADTDSTLYQGGKILAEIAGTAGAGGVLANGARALGASAPVVQGLSTGGLNVAGRSGFGGLLTRGVTGAVVGGAAAGMVNPDDAGVGAMIGGGLPLVAKGGAHAARAVGRSLTGEVSAEVAALADRAKQLGIDIPADRITNSKPLNLLASSLEYMPLSGRAGTMDRMAGQLNRAVSRTFGQDTDNVAQAVKSAREELGGEFDRVLKANTVTVDQQFSDDLAQHLQRAAGELGSDGERVIGKQVADIAAKIQNGQIDGQAAYNIKQTLDRIAKQNSPVSTYAKDLKNSLMAALNRSLGPDAAAAFAKTRQQYGNMKTIEKLVTNGVEGDVSIARLANQKGIHNNDLQELADISAQFLKAREGAHGAAQRLSIGSLGIGATGMASLPTAAALLAVGRATNAALNSNAARRMVTGGLLNQPSPLMRQGLLGASKVAPVLTAQ